MRRERFPGPCRAAAAPDLARPPPANRAAHSDAALKVPRSRRQSRIRIATLDRSRVAWRVSEVGGRRDAEHADALRSRKARAAIRRGDFPDCDPRRPTARQAHLRAWHMSHTRIP